MTFISLLQYGINKEEAIEAIQRNARRLNTLIKNILDVTKIEGNKLILYKEKFNLNDLLILILDDYKEHLKKPPHHSKGIKLLYELHNQTNKDTAALVYADKERITQVITNLLDNAIKFSQDNGIIKIILKIMDESLEGKSGQIDISIKNTGIGISEEIMPRLFKKFSTKSFQGTGLGLYISRSIIESHGGQIFAENNKNGKGATFLFNIPLVKSNVSRSILK